MIGSLSDIKNNIVSKNDITNIIAITSKLRKPSQQFMTRQPSND